MNWSPIGVLSAAIVARSRRSSHRARRARRGIVLSAFFAALGLAVAAAPAQAIVGGTTETFNYTGVEQTFEVPSGVFGVHIVAIGGTGGAAGAIPGGEAAYVSGSVSVTPGQTLYVEVGGKGKSEAEGGEGGFNGGGEGAGGGGGASDVRTLSRTTELTTQDTRLIVAAGGGGAGASGEIAGGAGGGAGEPGAATIYPGGGAGTATEGGAGGISECELGGPNKNGVTGELGSGGAGGDAEVETGPGGGGGGGLYGGGGGAGSCFVGSSGGGGGSSLTEGLVSLSSAAPEVQITYYPPPSASITSPPDGARYTVGKVVNASYSCEAGEGTFLKSCSGPVESGAPIDTSTPGPHSFTVTAEDIEYGKATKTVSYTVVPPPSIEIASPSGTTYTQGQAVTASYTCHAGTGAALTACVGPVASGVAIDTSTLGQHTFAVSAEDDLGAKASKSISYNVVSPPPPDTVLGSHPKKTVKTGKKKAKVKFVFSSDVAGATFECKLDKKAFAPCSSPKTYKVKPGKHKFSVRAVSNGSTDASPATFKFKVKRKR